jgi:hypothetical protein
MFYKNRFFSLHATSYDLSRAGGCSVGIAFSPEKEPKPGFFPHHSLQFDFYINWPHFQRVEGSIVGWYWPFHFMAWRYHKRLFWLRIPGYGTGKRHYIGGDFCG